MQLELQLISPADHESQPQDAPGVLVVANDVDPLEINLDGVQRIDLNFPKFSDGRAFSQAFLLRRRRRFTGEIRATGDVLIDQLVQMQRSGFTSAVLRADQKVEFVERQFARFPGFYQGDVKEPDPHFKEAA
jgi:uncharacterized protein (DUF934 family)